MVCEGLSPAVRWSCQICWVLRGGRARARCPRRGRKFCSARRPCGAQSSPWHCCTRARWRRLKSPAAHSSFLHRCWPRGDTGGWNYWVLHENTIMLRLRLMEARSSFSRRCWPQKKPMLELLRLPQRQLCGLWFCCALVGPSVVRTIFIAHIPLADRC